MTRSRFATASAWESAWLAGGTADGAADSFRSPSLIRSVGSREVTTTQEAYLGAVHYLGGRLHRAEFSLFRNGGLPLLERRSGPLREELLVRAGPRAVKGVSVPIALSLHLSHDGLREVRSRYWPGSGDPPTVLTSGNPGLLDEVAMYDIWNVVSEPCLPELADWCEATVLPFLELFARPTRLEQRLLAGDLPFFDPPTTLEWLLAERGKESARRYIEMRFGPEGAHESEQFERDVSEIRRSGVTVYRRGDPVGQSAVISFAHRLFSR